MILYYFLFRDSSQPMLRSTLNSVRERFHPIFHLKRTWIGRSTIYALDRPVSLHVQPLQFRIYGRLLTHGLGLAAAGSLERNPEALFRACFDTLHLQSFWDVGAHIGMYSWLAKQSGSDVRIVMFEPFPENTGLIHQTIRRNGFTGIGIREVAISDKAGTATFHTDVLSGATGSLEKSEATFAERHWHTAAGKLSVSTTTIDDEAARFGMPDFIKIDVEEHEARVLEGARTTLRTGHPFVFLECSHPDLACVHRLESYDYRIINADKLSREIGNSTNFAAVPPDYSGSIEGTPHEGARNSPIAAGVAC